jgi:hypothetical protein
MVSASQWRKAGWFDIATSQTSDNYSVSLQKNIDIPAQFGDHLLLKFPWKTYRFVIN